MKKLLIRDIAEQLNISTATVSYILNGKAKEKRISPDLTKRVQDFVAAHNYQPNQLAQSLRTGKTNVICLMVEDIADQFFAGVAGHIEDIAYERGYKIMYCSTKNDTQKAKELINTFKSRNVDGYIITPPQGIEEDVQSLLNAKSPVILFDRYYKKVKSSYVVMNNYESCYQATEHLYEQGYQNIAFVTLDSTQVQMTDRLDGYLACVKKHKRKPLVEQFNYAVRGEESVVTRLMDLMAQHPQTDAIFFATNYLAISGLEALSRLKLQIPNQVGVIAFDDNDLFRIHQPSITAVAQPIHEMSVQLINLLLQNIQSEEEVTMQNEVITGHLIVRESSVRKK